MPAEVTDNLREQLWSAAHAIGLRPRPVGLAIKRVLDFLGALLGLILLAPLLLLLALLIRCESAGPAFFRQQRLGQWGRPFTLYKLRTMVQNAERQGAGLAIVKDDPRITRLGRLLRATSFDELPQYLNVLKGEMSFIGPRPLPLAYLERWDERQKLRLMMPQGLSGWSQVVARNDAPWPERLERDVEYVRDWSLGFDFRIYFMTIHRIFARSGVATREGTVEEFKPPTTEAGAGTASGERGADE